MSSDNDLIDIISSIVKSFEASVLARDGNDLSCHVSSFSDLTRGEVIHTQGDVMLVMRGGVKEKRSHLTIDAVYSALGHDTICSLPSLNCHVSAFLSSCVSPPLSLSDSLYKSIRRAGKDIGLILSKFANLTHLASHMGGYETKEHERFENSARQYLISNFNASLELYVTERVFLGEVALSPGSKVYHSLIEARVPFYWAGTVFHGTIADSCCIGRK